MRKLRAPAQVGLAGCGHWGRNLARNFAALGALARIYDPNPGTLELARLQPAISIADSFEDLVESDLSAVVIATPAATHFQLARRALLSGKDVFVEKPLALRVEQGAELVRLAKMHARILMVGHVLEYHPAVVEICRMARDGYLGRICYIYSHRLSLGTIRGEENILWSFAPHDIAVILRLTGAAPVEVTACGGIYLQPGIPDVTVTQFLFDRGVRAHIHVSWLHPFKEQRLVVIGARRMASFDDVAKKLVVYDQRVDFVEGDPRVIKSGSIERPFASAEPLRLECEAFLDAVETRLPPLTDGESGLAVLEVLDACQRSLSDNGSAVTLAQTAEA